MSSQNVSTSNAKKKQKNEEINETNTADVLGLAP